MRRKRHVFVMTHTQYVEMGDRMFRKHLKVVKPFHRGFDTVLVRLRARMHRK